MRLCETKGDGETWFAVEHNKEYRRLQELFLMAVQSYNPDNLQVTKLMSNASNIIFIFSNFSIVNKNECLISIPSPNRFFNNPSPDSEL